MTDPSSTDILPDNAGKSQAESVSRPNGADRDGFEIYAALAAPFAEVHHDTRGGVSLTYITGEQVIQRLNEVLGVHRWSFRVLEHGIHAEADEAWALGELLSKIDGETVVRQQFGSQKVHRNAPLCATPIGNQGDVCGDKRYDHDKRHSDHSFMAGPAGAPLDYGFDLKGASTDAMKKCASLLGVGLYLSYKPGAASAKRAAATSRTQVTETAARPAPQPAPAAAARTLPAAAPKPAPTPQPATRSSEAHMCMVCGEPLTKIDAKEPDGNGGMRAVVWSSDDLAARGMQRYGKKLCPAHFRDAVIAANNAKQGIAS